MKINVLNLLLENEKEIEVNLDKSINSDKLKDDRFEVISPIKVFGKLTFSNDIVRFDGSVEATCNFICDRCLEAFVCDLETDFYEEFKVGVNENDEDFRPIVNDVIDLEESAIKSILINIPIKLLCKEECAGIEYEKEVEEEVKNSPFNVLKDFKFED